MRTGNGPRRPGAAEDLSLPPPEAWIGATVAARPPGVKRGPCTRPGPRIMASNGTPQGPIVKGGWGSEWAWSPETQSFSVCVKPGRPPAKVTPPPPEVCRYGHRGRMDLNSQGRRICLDCRREASRRAREKRAA